MGAGVFSVNKDERAYAANYIYAVLGIEMNNIPYDLSEIRNPLKIRKDSLSLLQHYGINTTNVALYPLRRSVHPLTALYTRIFA